MKKNTLLLFLYFFWFSLNLYCLVFSSDKVIGKENFYPFSKSRAAYNEISGFYAPNVDIYFYDSKTNGYYDQAYKNKDVKPKRAKYVRLDSWYYAYDITEFSVYTILPIILIFIFSKRNNSKKIK